MVEGVVVRVMREKRYGFIRAVGGTEYFFHADDVNGFYDDIVDDIERKQTVKVSFESASSLKGPRASEVTRLSDQLPVTSQQVGYTATTLEQYIVLGGNKLTY